MREAYYEPSGSVSVIPKTGEVSTSAEEEALQVVDMQVEEGMQTVRIALKA